MQIQILTRHVTGGLDKINQSLTQIKIDIANHGIQIASLENSLSVVNSRLDNPALL